MRLVMKESEHLLHEVQSRRTQLNDARSRSMQGRMDGSLLTGWYSRSVLFDVRLLADILRDVF